MNGPFSAGFRQRATARRPGRDPVEVTVEIGGREIIAVLSAARFQDERVARAFAAELLAPAEGIRLALETIGEDDDSAADSFRRGAW